MKALSLLLLSVGAMEPLLVSSHYRFVNLTVGTTTTSDATRIPLTYDPLLDVTLIDMRCNMNNGPASSTLRVKAGSKMSFGIVEQGLYIYHQGPAAMYLGKVPEGETAATWDGSGSNWFKIKDWSGEPYTHPNYPDSPYWEFASHGLAWLDFEIPAEVPSGEYLLRAEQTAIHYVHEPQWYVSCAQLKIVDGGQGNPPMVAIPGHVRLDDPNIQLDVNVVVPGFVYRVPGPDVWPSGVLRRSVVGKRPDRYLAQ